VCLACVVGFMRSTHKIQYVPLKEEEILPPTSEIEEEFEAAELKKVGRKKLISEADEAVEEVTKSDSLF
jgi:hypothetical protein